MKDRFYVGSDGGVCELCDNGSADVYTTSEIVQRLNSLHHQLNRPMRYEVKVLSVGYDERDRIEALINAHMADGWMLLGPIVIAGYERVGSVSASTGLMATMQRRVPCEAP